MEKYTLEYYLEKDRLTKEKAREYQSMRNNKIKLELQELREYKKKHPLICPHCQEPL